MIFYDDMQSTVITSMTIVNYYLNDDYYWYIEGRKIPVVLLFNVD